MKTKKEHAELVQNLIDELRGLVDASEEMTTSQAIVALLELRAPVALSAGEITTALNAGGADWKRPEVKSVCERLARDGKVSTEKKLFRRGTGEWPGTAYLAKRTRPWSDEDPFARS